MKRRTAVLMALLLSVWGSVPASAGAVPEPQIEEGSYVVDMKWDLSLPEAEECILTKDRDGMTILFLSGSSCEAIYAGDAFSAASAEETDICRPVKNPSGENAYTLAIDALDQAFDISVLDKSDEKWHQGTLTILSGRIPKDAFIVESLVTAEELGLENGTYTADVTLKGGTGKVSVQSPALLNVTDGKVTAEIIWSSSHYDYMIVSDIRYERENTEGNSVFRIPVEGFDSALSVIGNTTAMSRPHEIEYTLRFDSGTLQPYPAE